MEPAFIRVVVFLFVVVVLALVAAGLSWSIARVNRTRRRNITLIESKRRAWGAEEDARR